MGRTATAQRTRGGATRGVGRSPRPGSGGPPQREITRTQIVWATFICSMTVVCGVLLLFDGSIVRRDGGGIMLGPSEVVGRPSRLNHFDLGVRLDDGRWRAIVIHHSGSPAGSPGQIHRQHQAWGLDGLGYHFIIGNGNGMADGSLHVGYRWSEQLPGSHAIGPEQAWYNEHAISICLIGNGESRPFTDRQKETLINLVQHLQGRLEIAEERVCLHRDIADILSPGRYFPEAEFRQRLASSR